MRFQFIRQHRTLWPIRLMCKVLQVSCSGFYAWCKRPPSQQTQRRQRLVVQVKAIHAQSRRIYGSPRVHRELRSRGCRCCVNTVAGIMGQNGIQSRSKRKFKATTDSGHSHPVAANKLARQFDVDAPNRVWVADITYIPTREGWLYLALVLDLFSRGIVGWSMSARVKTPLVLEALEMAIQRRRPGPGLLHHSDRGSQYASEAYQRLLQQHQMEPSMSRKGNCWDNAPAEGVIGTI